MVDIDKPTQLPNFGGSTDIARSIGFGVGVFRGRNDNRQLFQILRNVNSIRDNIRNILYFRKGDYYDDPDFGVGLQDYLFDPQDEVLTLALNQEIRRQIRKYENRVKITTLRIFSRLDADNAIFIDLVLDVNGTSLQGNGDTRGNFSLFQKENS